MQRSSAEQLAQEEDIYLEGLTGDHQGKIGALAAVGLHSSGNDGRYIWVRGIRELQDQTLNLAELLENTGIEVVVELGRDELKEPEMKIELGPWPRPIPVNGRATLLVEKSNGGTAHWQVADKEIIKSYRP